ncbi:MAG: LPS export ABC transporter permease LptF [Pseudomonadales bacterium]|nr:LPS export ABC transporter permease LptF [Pseudomonadales bacterium]
MIFYRYIAKEILQSMLAVSLVLLIVLLSGRFIKYLADAATGELDPDLLFTLMLCRVPGLLEQILPLGLFLGILLVLGRMYVENEISVFFATGNSRNDLLRITMVPVALVAVIVAVISLYVTPLGISYSEALLNQQNTRSELEQLEAGRFQMLRGGKGVIYTEGFDKESGRLKEVFIASQNNIGAKGETILVASQGWQKIDEITGERYLMLEKGFRNKGVPGEASYEVTTFRQYAQRVPPIENAGLRRLKEDSLSTGELWQSPNIDYKAALQWRFSLPLVLPIIALLAIALSKTSPRQGRFIKILPGIIIYMLYMVALNLGRDAMIKGQIPSWMGLWWVHLLFLSVALFAYNFDYIYRRYFAWQEGG